MSEHWPESMIGETISAWCRQCGRLTKHRMDRVAIGSNAARPGPCLEHRPKVNDQGESKTQEAHRQARERQNAQQLLFEKYTEELG